MKIAMELFCVPYPEVHFKCCKGTSFGIKPILKRQNKELYDVVRFQGSSLNLYNAKIIFLMLIKMLIHFSKLLHTTKTFLIFTILNQKTKTYEKKNLHNRGIAALYWHNA